MGRQQAKKGGGDSGSGSASGSKEKPGGGSASARSKSKAKGKARSRQKGRPGAAAAEEAEGDSDDSSGDDEADGDGEEEEDDEIDRLIARDREGGGGGVPRGGLGDERGRGRSGGSRQRSDSGVGERDPLGFLDGLLNNNATEGGTSKNNIGGRGGEPEMVTSRECEKCTYMNLVETKTCLMCESPLPLVPKKVGGTTRTKGEGAASSSSKPSPSSPPGPSRALSPPAGGGGNKKDESESSDSSAEEDSPPPGPRGAAPYGKDPGSSSSPAKGPLSEVRPKADPDATQKAGGGKTDPSTASQQQSPAAAVESTPLHAEGQKEKDEHTGIALASASSHQAKGVVAAFENAPVAAAVASVSIPAGEHTPVSSQETPAAAKQTSATAPEQQQQQQQQQPSRSLEVPTTAAEQQQLFQSGDIELPGMDNPGPSSTGTAGAPLSTGPGGADGTSPQGPAPPHEKERASAERGNETEEIKRNPHASAAGTENGAVSFASPAAAGEGSGGGAQEGGGRDGLCGLAELCGLASGGSAEKKDERGVGDSPLNGSLSFRTAVSEHPPLQTSAAAGGGGQGGGERSSRVGAVSAVPSGSHGKGILFSVCTADIDSDLGTTRGGTGGDVLLSFAANALEEVDTAGNKDQTQKDADEALDARATEVLYRATASEFFVRPERLGELRALAAHVENLEERRRAQASPGPLVVRPSSSSPSPSPPPHHHAVSSSPQQKNPGRALPGSAGGGCRLSPSLPLDREKETALSSTSRGGRGSPTRDANRGCWRSGVSPTAWLDAGGPSLGAPSQASVAVYLERHQQGQRSAEEEDSAGEKEKQNSGDASAQQQPALPTSTEIFEAVEKAREAAALIAEEGRKRREEIERRNAEKKSAMQAVRKRLREEDAALAAVVDSKWKSLDRFVAELLMKVAETRQELRSLAGPAAAAAVRRAVEQTPEGRGPLGCVLEALQLGAVLCRQSWEEVENLCETELMDLGSLTETLRTRARALEEKGEWPQLQLQPHCQSSSGGGGGRQRGDGGESPMASPRVAFAFAETMGEVPEASRDGKALEVAKDQLARLQIFPLAHAAMINKLYEAFLALHILAGRRVSPPAPPPAGEEEFAARGGVPLSYGNEGQRERGWRSENGFHGGFKDESPYGSSSTKRRGTSGTRGPGHFFSGGGGPGGGMFGGEPEREAPPLGGPSASPPSPRVAPARQGQGASTKVASPPRLNSSVPLPTAPAPESAAVPKPPLRGNSELDPLPAPFVARQRERTPGRETHRGAASRSPRKTARETHGSRGPTVIQGGGRLRVQDPSSAFVPDSFDSMQAASSPIEPPPLVGVTGGPPRSHPPPPRNATSSPTRWEQQQTAERRVGLGHYGDMEGDGETAIVFEGGDLPGRPTSPSPCRLMSPDRDRSLSGSPLRQGRGAGREREVSGPSDHSGGEGEDRVVVTLRQMNAGTRTARQKKQGNASGNRNGRGRDIEADLSPHGRRAEPDSAPLPLTYRDYRRSLSPNAVRPLSAATKGGAKLRLHREGERYSSSRERRGSGERDRRPDSPPTNVKIGVALGGYGNLERGSARDDWRHLDTDAGAEAEGEDGGGPGRSPFKPASLSLSLPSDESLGALRRRDSGPPRSALISAGTLEGFDASFRTVRNPTGTKTGNRQGSFPGSRGRGETVPVVVARADGGKGAALAQEDFQRRRDRGDPSRVAPRRSGAPVSTDAVRIAVSTSSLRPEHAAAPTRGGSQLMSRASKPSRRVVRASTDSSESVSVTDLDGARELSGRGASAVRFSRKLADRIRSMVVEKKKGGAAR
uniref:RanBP2-type domain-containing protein n=1 Tax=Chromera velia CCMP2878 TaxID=1169474 RepID=A0A0G4HWE5_9ALVE|eukprot:Cvel_1436.t1-p1 / transcript=Cvel_1436.t1 / gene=Cvel_1436 / organism=Chromera_velia_CCMP2878 / gene_product=hypothetical protein / transcript_product=hypothetical protein / location=Cvel_scaffold50:72064-83581(+) / protein_length=1796 / sequence_SO=supercontig / SO=protein_coding / is_pseudo=false